MPAPAPALPRTARVLIVDDHPVFAESLAFVLDSDPRFAEVRVADSLAGARDAAPHREYDLALVDVRLGDGNGLDLVAELRALRPQTTVLVLTAHPRPDVVTRARAAGAIGVVTKGTPLAELIEILGQTVTGEEPALLDAPAMWPEDDEETTTLTNRELDIVRLLAAGHEVRGIARVLGISVHTVRDHVKKVLAKLDAPNQLGAVLAAHRAGLISLDRG